MIVSTIRQRNKPLAQTEIPSTTTTRYSLNTPTTVPVDSIYRNTRECVYTLSRIAGGIVRVGDVRTILTTVDRKLRFFYGRLWRARHTQRSRVSG